MFQITSQSQNTDSQLQLKQLRQQCLDSLNTILKDKAIGFIQLPQRNSLWEDCERVARTWRGQVDQIVLIGTGGSSLGFQAIAETFGLSQFLFVDNVDPVYLQTQMKMIRDFKRTGWVVISKSGTTIETLCALEVILQNYELSRFVAVITEKKSNSLGLWAEKNQYTRLEVPLDVGGRYSVLSPVGMFPAALADLNLELFKSGAKKALEQLDLAAELAAQSLLSFKREEWITVFWIYSSRGFFWGRWIQQLWAESLAKAENLKGQKAPRVSTPVTAIGATDQHSVLQQMMEGAQDKFFWFLRFGALEKSERLEKSHFPETKSLVGHSMGDLLAAEAQATVQALQQKGRSHLILKTEVSMEKSSGEEALGFFFMLMELVVAGMAHTLQIDAFNQPGVELGKRLARDHFNTRS